MLLSPPRSPRTNRAAPAPKRRCSSQNGAGNIKKSRGLLREGTQVALYAFIEAEKANYPIQVLCEVLEVPRASFYAWRNAKPGPRKQEEQKLRVQLRALHAESKGTYGAPRLRAALRRQGVSVSRKRVANLLQNMGLKGLPRIRRVRTTVADPQAEPAPNRLQRQFTVEAPNRVWVTDIT